MSNPTTPFGWQMPENTDLVTDLPADFEVFGQAVATDLQYLLGGTTGQVLAKASATDLDFDWVADAAGMTNPMTTTGDSIYSSSGSTPARLGIGSAGQVLTVASGLPSWATPTAGGITQLATGSLTGISTVTLSNISQAYKHLYVTVVNAQGASNGATVYRPNNVSTANGYKTMYIYLNDATWITGSFSVFPNRIDVSSDANEMDFLEIPNYTLTGYKMLNLTHAGATMNRSTLSFGRNSDTAAITSLVIMNGDAVNFSAGTYTLFGVS